MDEDSKQIVDSLVKNQQFLIESTLLLINKLEQKSSEVETWKRLSASHLHRATSTMNVIYDEVVPLLKELVVFIPGYGDNRNGEIFSRTHELIDKLEFEL